MDELKEQIEVFGERLPLGEMLQRIAGGGMKTLERVMAAERRVAEFQQGGKCLGLGKQFVFNYNTFYQARRGFNINETVKALLLKITSSV